MQMWCLLFSAIGAAGQEWRLKRRTEEVNDFAAGFLDSRSTLLSLQTLP